MLFKLNAEGQEGLQGLAQPGIWRTFTRSKDSLVHQNKQEVLSPLWVVSDPQSPICPCPGVILVRGTTKGHEKTLGGWLHIFTILIIVCICPHLSKYVLLFQFSSVTQLCPTLCDPMNRSTPGLPVHHQLPESTQTHVH